ncbi:MAG: AmmeMemoRadiSam system protein B [Nitrososphaerales archaeon]
MAAGSTRLPAVAGMFYPLDKDELFESIHRCFTHSLGPGRFPDNTNAKKKENDRVECLIVPHAGYEFSGPIAANSYLVAHDFFQTITNKMTTAIIIGPNHYGIGSGVALSSATTWLTPLGEIKIAGELSKKLRENCDIIDVDDIAHYKEHSIEVQLPFLQAVSKKGNDLRILPISLVLQDIETAQQIAEGLLELIKSTDGEFLVIGSSDLTHYEAQAQATKKDAKLLESVTKLDLKDFYSVLERLSISACGYGAIATVMQVAKKLGRKRGVVLKYATSGDVTGDKSAVVGYPSVRFI